MTAPPAAADGQERPRPNGQAAWLLALAAITLVGAGLRFYDCGHALWLDELHTSWCASGEWTEVSHRARLGNQPPLYFWLAWLVTAGSGGHEILLRLPSLLAGTLLLPAVGWIGYRLAGKPQLGLIAAALVAVNPWFIYYAQEARGYALVQLASLGHVFALVAVTDRATLPRRAVFVLLTVALFYLHYTALLILIGEGAWYVLARRWRSERHPEQGYTLPRIWIDLTLALLLTLPGWSDVFAIFARRQAWKAFVPEVGIRSFFHQFAWLYLIAPGLVFAAAAVWLQGRSSPATDAAASTTTDPKVQRSSLLGQANCAGLLACWFLAPLACVWMLSYFEIAPLFYGRFLGTLAVVPSLAAAWLCSIPTRAWLRCAATAATFAVALWQYHPWTVYQHYGRFAARVSPDWKAAIAWVESDAGKLPPQPVFYWAGLIEGGDPQRAAQDATFRDYLTYAFRGCYHFHPSRLLEPIFNRPDEWKPGPLSAAQLKQLRKAGGGWLIYAGEPSLSQRVANDVQQQLTPQDPSPPAVRGLNGITIYRVEVR